MSKLPLHPFLFAIYAVLSLYTNNVAQVPVEQVIRPLVAFLLLAAILGSLFHVISKDRYYAAYAASWTLIWFSFFGRVYQAANLSSIFTGRSANETVTLAIWTVTIAFIGAPFVWKNIRNKKLINDVLTAVSVGAAIIPVFAIAAAITKEQQASRLVADWQAAQPKIGIHTAENSPDIYYIILDGYARQDILQDYYNLDNSEFIAGLIQHGFYVASQSHSNYMQTALSLSSTFNLEYANFLSAMDGDNRSAPYQMVEVSRLRAALENAGYQTINIASPLLFTQFRDFDQYLAPGDPTLTEFEKLLLSLTVAAPFAKNNGVLIPGYESHRVYTLNSFQALGEVAKMPGPKFVFTHVVGPHPPFVFDALGNPIQSDYPYLVNDASGFPGTRQEYIAGYTNELQYINSLVLQAVEAILQHSSRPPIIIIQGDHGPGAYTNLFDFEKNCNRERGSILNAYYFPDQNYTGLAPDITPVNSFRVILNQYFGADLPLLENHVYFSYWDAPYHFIEVTQKLDEPCKQ